MSESDNGDGYNLEPMVFEDDTRIEIPVTIKGREYILREADGNAGCQYRNAIIGSAELNAKGRPSRMKGVADADPLLVSLCLFRVEDNRPVHVSVIRNWPNRIQKALCDRVKEISDLGDTEEDMDEAEARAKNGQDEKVAGLS